MPLIILFFALGVSSVKAQISLEKLEEVIANSSFRQKFETGNGLMDDQLFEYAVKIWGNLLEEQPDNYNLNYKMGYCYLNISLERKKALPYLLKAEDGINKNYDPYGADEKKLSF